MTNKTVYPWTNRDRAIIRETIKLHLGKSLTEIKIAVRACTRLDYWDSSKFSYLRPEHPIYHKSH